STRCNRKKRVHNSRRPPLARGEPRTRDALVLPPCVPRRHAVRHRSFCPPLCRDFRRKPKRQRPSAPKRSIGKKLANRSAKQHFDRQFFEFVFVRRLLPLKMIRVHPP